MALTHLLDTTILCQPIKDAPISSVIDRWSALDETSVCTASICLAELLKGLEERQSQKYWRRYRELLEKRYTVLPFEAATAVQFAKTSALLKKAGTPKPDVDLLIAATALHHNLRIVTLNLKHFADIPDLRVEDWSTS